MLLTATTATLLLLLPLLLLLLWRLTRPRIDLSHIPGPTSSVWWEIFSPPDPSKAHLGLQRLAQKYGPVFKIPTVTGDDRLVVCDFDCMYKVSVTEGKTFGGRPTSFRVDSLLNQTGIVMNSTWRTLRKMSQRHLRQFGDGLSRLETIIVNIAEDMFGDFERHQGKAYNPHNVVFDTALNSIAFLMIGKRTKPGEEILEQMLEYMRTAIYIGSPSAPFGLRILDALPWTRFFQPKTWGQFQRVLELESNIWKTAIEYSKENPDAESICTVLMDHIRESQTDLTEQDAVKTTLMLLLAGVTTTSNTVYGTINILAHNPHIQQKILDEIFKVETAKGAGVTLADRPSMPYSRAVILETLRYGSVVAMGVTHRSLEKAQVGGYTIPACTSVSLFGWELHHNEEFWESPYSFKPERFLDETGDLVAADHPNRRHLMPFGAGPRVCLGESLALTRLFLWITSLVKRFEVRPAPGNREESTDPRGYNLKGVLQPTPYTVIFETRN